MAWKPQLSPIVSKILLGNIHLTLEIVVEIKNYYFAYKTYEKIYNLILHWSDNNSHKSNIKIDELYFKGNRIPNMMECIIKVKINQWFGEKYMIL